MSNRRDEPYDDVMARLFQKDPAYAAELLNNILADGDQGELLVALRQMSKAFGGVSGLAGQTQLNRPHLYRSLSSEGNPEFRTLTAILETMGLRLAVQPIKKTSAAPRRKSAPRRLQRGASVA
jgi:probable addiction module antidote protein